MGATAYVVKTITAATVDTVGACGAAPGSPDRGGDEAHTGDL
jgi:hypothetical protein